MYLVWLGQGLSVFRRFWRAGLLAAVALGAMAAGERYVDFRESLSFDAKTHFALREYRSLREWEARRARLRRQVLSAAGLYPLPEKTPLNARRFDLKEFAAFRVEKVLIQPIPGFYLAGNLYAPKRAARRRPAVLVAHGHWKNGRVHHAPDYSVPALCANLAAQGYVAFAYDMVGYNDTRQLSHDFGTTEREMMWSFSPLGVQLWDSIRALDFLQSLPEVDPSRIAMTGASGGATQTILLAAVDDRIAASAPVNMVSASFQGDDACEMAPGLRVGTNNVEIASLAAPRPMLLVSATGDWTRNTPGLELPAILSIYRLYGRVEKLASAHIEAVHNFNGSSRRAVYEFLARQLRRSSDPAPGTEIDISELRREDLLIGQEHIPPGLTREQLFTWWCAQAQRRAETLSIPQLRDAVLAALDLRWPQRVSVFAAGRRILLEDAASGERVSAQWLPGRDSRTTLVVNPGGLDAARETPEVRRELERGMSVLLVEAFRTGEKPPRGPADRGSLTYRRSDDNNRVRDIATAIAFLGGRHGGEIRLVCPGEASAWCYLAAAVSPVRLELDADLVRRVNADPSPFRPSFVPGLQCAGGWRSAWRLLDAMQPKPLAVPLATN